jgi:hypothetical protein
MKNATNLILTVIAASLILVTGCYDNVTEYQPAIGYEGFVNAGWDDFDAGDYESARTNFESAIDIDVTRPEAYLGAGWTALLQPDYWVIGDQYDYMAVQQDGGTWPVGYVAEAVEQDLMWTVFECIDPVLTANDLLVIGSFGDSLLVVEGDTLVPHFTVSSGDTTWYLAVSNLEIGDWLYSQYGNVAFKYTYEIDDPNVMALFSFVNNFSNTVCKVDSIVNGTESSVVYLNVPYKLDNSYRTWCMNENVMIYDYTTYSGANGQTSIANDGVAAFGILQSARGVNGLTLEGIAALMGLADEVEYSFTHYAGLSSVKLKGMAAAMAYANTEFRFALYICRSEGYAMNIEITDPDFLVELMQQIEMMLQ